MLRLSWSVCTHVSFKMSFALFYSTLLSPVYVIQLRITQLQGIEKWDYFTCANFCDRWFFALEEILRLKIQRTTNQLIFSMILWAAELQNQN